MSRGAVQSVPMLSSLKLDKKVLDLYQHYQWTSSQCHGEIAECTVAVSQIRLRMPERTDYFHMLNVQSSPTTPSIAPVSVCSNLYACKSVT